MALTRKSLKAMGLTDEQVESIVEMHAETVDALKDKLKAAEEKADNFDKVSKELNDIKAKGSDDYKGKYDSLKKEYDDYKANITAKELKAAKEKAVRAFFESKNITGANLDIAMRGAKDEVNAIELENEKIKDTKALDELVNGMYAGLVVKSSAKGANTSTPPNNTGGNKLSKDDIMKIKDAGERQKAIAENHELFGF